MATSRITKLLERQAQQLARLQDAEVRRVVRAYDDARRQLHEQLRVLGTSASTGRAQRLRVHLAQVEAGRADMMRRMGEAMTGAELKLHKRSTRDLLRLVRAAEPKFGEVGQGIDVRIAERLTRQQGLALHQHSLTRYGAEAVERIQRELAAGIVQGLSQRQLADRVAGAGGSVLSGMRGRAALIARMETSRAYNDGHLEGMEELNERLPRPSDPVLKRIDEFIDPRRNHPFSQYANGTTAALDEPFVVKAPTLGGMVWQRTRGGYTGVNLPAHFGDRGRISAWRRGWGASPGEREKPKRKRKPKPKPKPKPGLAGSSRWKAAERSLAKARAAASAAGLDPDRYGVGADLRRDLEAMFAAAPNPSSKELRDLTRAGLSRIHESLPRQNPLAQRLQSEIDLQDAVTMSYRRAVAEAPHAWLEAERLRWSSALLGPGPQTWPADQRAGAIHRWHRSLRTLPEDLLRLLAADGVSLHHVYGNPRPFHSAPDNLTSRVTLDLGTLRDDASTEDHLYDHVAVVPHEFAHAMDRLFSGYSKATGRPWVSIPGYEDFVAGWETTYRDTYEAAKTGGVEQGLARGEWNWTGHWAGTGYEARIYSTTGGEPSRRDLQRLGGPIEFIAQSATYRAQDARVIRRHVLDQLSAKDYGTAEWVGTSPAPAARRRGVSARMITAIYQSRGAVFAKDLRVAYRLHGPAYRDGVERIMRSGETLLREIGEHPEVRFQGDNDVVLTALLVRDRYGVSWERSLGPDGVLHRHLSGPVTRERFEALEGEIVPGRFATVFEEEETWDAAAAGLLEPGARF